MNTLDLDPEWGAIDLIEEVEKEFGIKFTNEEVEPCETVGDFFMRFFVLAPQSGAPMVRDAPHQWHFIEFDAALILTGCWA